MIKIISRILIILRISRIVLTPKWMRIVTNLSDGLIVTGKNIKGYGGRGIYIFREQIEPEFRDLNNFLKEGDVFIDVGANTGIYTLKAAKRIGELGVVISLEPNPEFLGEISYNVKLNRFKNVRLRGLCAAGEIGQDKFWTNFDRPHSFSLIKRDENAVSLSVLKVRLDDLFIWEKLSRCDYIKIDAEGSEKEILEGAGNIIETYRPIIQAEISVSNFSFNPKDYTVFRARDRCGAFSPNKLFIPNESKKIVIASNLGYELIG